MTSRLFCSQCKKYFTIDIDYIRLVQKKTNQKMRYSNNTYYFDNGCFCKELNKVKRESLEVTI